VSATLQACVGLAAFPLIAWVLAGRARVSAAAFARVCAVGLGLQLAVALVFLKIAVVRDAVFALNAVVDALKAATRAGTSVVFGYLGGGDLPFAEPYPGASFILAFDALPIILVISALSALLFHWGVLQRVVRAFAWGLRRTMGLGGPAGLAAAANVFVGMVEAPLLVRPYIAKLSRADLFLVMTVGMATIAGTVLVLYATLVEPRLPGALGHIITASIISVPAAVLTARLMAPPAADEAAYAADETDAAADPDMAAPETHSALEAVTKGTIDGVTLLIHIIALLVVFIALVSLVNAALGLGPDIAGAPLTLERILGWLLAPVAWAMGLPWAEAQTGGALIGLKTVLNEFVAYLALAQTPPEALSDRSVTILTYALCGFANPGSLGIMIGGLIAMAPDRRADILALGPRTIVSGTLATCLTGAVVGLLT
jgi:CNT family concentrative nucleoside transporter